MNTDAAPKPLIAINCATINQVPICLFNSARLVALLSASAMLAACVRSVIAPTNVSVYKYLSSIQCYGGGTTISTLQQKLTDAGIQVETASCGSDGKMYAAVCGAADGRIGIFDVSVTQVEAAIALGFAPLSKLPTATKITCQ